MCVCFERERLVVLESSTPTSLAFRGFQPWFRVR